MIIILFSSLSFLALVALLKLNSYLLANQKATAKQSATEKARQSAIQQEGFDRSKALRAENRKLHGATALRSNAHEYTREAETPVPGYVPVWASNGIMSVIIYVAPDNVDGKANERAQQALRAEWDASFIGRCVNGVSMGFAGALVLLIAAPVILLFCLPILGVCALIGFPTIGLFLLIAWCLSDFQNGVADAVVKKMKQ